MPDTPFFSVTIPAYNAEVTLEETVASIRAQEFRDWETVIVDDGSTDGTLALAESLSAQDGRIRVVTQENRGSGGAYNTAVHNARAQWIVMLSADDLLMPGHLAAFRDAIEKHADDSIFTCGGWYEYDDGTRELSTLAEAWADPARCTLLDLESACFFGIGSVYRREVWVEVGGFPEDLYAEDYVFFLTAMALGFTHSYVDAPLAVHRRNSTQKSADVIRVRQADIVALERLIATGRLSEQERGKAQAVIGRHKRNIAIRRFLTSLVGSERSSRLIDRAKGRRHVDRQS